MPSVDAISPTFIRHTENGLPDFIYYSRYAHYRPEFSRRETYAEAINRIKQMHQARFATQWNRRSQVDFRHSPAHPADHALLSELLGGSNLGDLINRAFLAVEQRQVLPSMRSLQFAGKDLSQNPASMFNCAFSLADRPEFFREYFYLLLSGTGCGFSVQYEHVRRLPPLALRHDMRLRTVRHPVAKGPSGWADALHHLMRSYFEGFAVEFDYTAMRDSPTAIASEHTPLRHLLETVAAMLDAVAGRRLQPIEIYDLCMLVSHAASSWGTRRAASICLFSADDEQMMHAKTGRWLQEHPHRTASNNSAVILRAVADEAVFRRLLVAQKYHGEPGFYFSDHPDYGCNPCGEAGLHPVLMDMPDAAGAARLRLQGYDFPLSRLSGWQMCNLTTINGTAVRNPVDLLSAAFHAAVIGTLQAAYTDIGYLGPVTRYLNECDALLGVSICGFMDNPRLLFAPRLLERAAAMVRAANEVVAHVIGIRPAARTTCVKPEGTTSLLLGTAAGIHPHYARRYFRRVQVRRSDPVYQEFRTANPEMCEISALHPESNDCIVFPVEAPPQALVRTDDSAIEFLQRVLLVQQHWVIAGEAPGTRSPGLHHNISHSCPVRKDEWEDVAAYIWRHRHLFSGVALFADEASSHYPQSPLSSAHTRADAALWNQLACRPVNYSSVPDTGSASASAEFCADNTCETP